MKLDIRKIIVVLFLVIQMLAFSMVCANSGFTVEVTSLQIFRDGLCNVKQTMIVDEFYPQIIVPLFSSSIENLVVIDQNQKPVDYEINNFNLTIFTLGSNQISIEYDTMRLTNKDAEVWSIIIDNQYDTTICLPKNSTVVFLSEMPTAIDTQDNVITFTLYPNQWEISYVLSPSSIDEIDNGETDNNLILIGYSLIVLVLAILAIILLIFFSKRRKLRLVNYLSGAIETFRFYLVNIGSRLKTNLVCIN